ncbi:unnamed protein product [Symbiodinium sp. CCMP2592]|nr:unnamed protein product [Symbiodinium sp. CCMP2592]
MASRGFAEIEPVLRRACSGQSHDATHGGEDEEDRPSVRTNIRVGDASYTPPPEPAANPEESALNARTAFRTEGGLHLFFPPDTLDLWVNKEVKTNDEGELFLASSGEPLTPQQAGEYAAYQARLSHRYRLGDQADRLVRIVDKWLPHVAAENRVFTMRFPEKVPALLEKAWALRRRRAGGERPAPHLRRSSQCQPKQWNRSFGRKATAKNVKTKEGETRNGHGVPKAGHRIEPVANNGQTNLRGSHRTDQAETGVADDDQVSPRGSRSAAAFSETSLVNLWGTLQQGGDSQPVVQHETRGGLHLLFLPSPLDTWIGRNVQHNDETGELYDEKGEPLGEDDQEAYASYRGRLRNRQALGAAADKLVKITDAREVKKKKQAQRGKGELRTEETPPDWGSTDEDSREDDEQDQGGDVQWQKQAAGEVEGMRQKHAQACSNREQSRRQRLEEFRQRISVKVDVVLEANGRAVVNVQLAAKDGVPGISDTEIDIPMNDETAHAATKIQAKFRQKQAAGEVDAKRREKEKMHDAAENEIDIPMNDETAQAATKIQAKFRQKQAAGEVEAKRREKEEMHSAADKDIDIPMDDETAQAATKIQAKFRQKQAASEVEAMRKEKLKSESGDGAAEAEPSDVDRFEPDVDIEQAELARPADEISEVEAMLKEKEKEQQQLVEDNSPKVEGMFGSKQEKRPMAVSPAIPEGDEE